MDLLVIHLHGKIGDTSVEVSLGAEGDGSVDVQPEGFRVPAVLDLHSLRFEFVEVVEEGFTFFCLAAAFAVLSTCPVSILDLESGLDALGYQEECLHDDLLLPWVLVALWRGSLVDIHYLKGLLLGLQDGGVRLRLCQLQLEEVDVGVLAGVSEPGTLVPMSVLLVSGCVVHG